MKQRISDSSVFLFFSMSKSSCTGNFTHSLLTSVPQTQMSLSLHFIAAFTLFVHVDINRPFASVQIPGTLRLPGRRSVAPVWRAGGSVPLCSSGGAVWHHPPHRTTQRPARQRSKCLHNTKPGKGVCVCDAQLERRSFLLRDMTDGFFYSPKESPYSELCLKRMSYYWH